MITVYENVRLAELTTMRLGGVARYVVEVKAPREVKKAYDFAAELNLPVWVMGGGANTIGRDEGFDGVVILNKLTGIEIVKEVGGEIWLTGMGGEKWDDFVEFACRRGYSGIEALSAIPGTLGAAPVQNIGAYGQEISQVLEEVYCYDKKTGRAQRIPKNEMKLKYRQSIFNTGRDVGRYFIISVTVRLRRGRMAPPFYNSLQAYIDEHHETDFSPRNMRRMVAAIRAAKLPDPETTPSAGSFFKNVTLSPEEAVAAEKKGFPVYTKVDGSKIINSGWLIEEAGLKGKVFHGMKVSDKAALILINESAKSYADLAAAREEIRGIIREKFGYDIAQEPVEVSAEANYTGGAA